MKNRYLKMSQSYQPEVVGFLFSPFVSKIIILPKQFFINKHTHTHTHIYIYIYIYRERERERENGPEYIQVPNLWHLLLYYAPINIIEQIILIQLCHKHKYNGRTDKLFFLC